MAGITDLCCSDVSRGIWFIVLCAICIVLTIGNLAVTTTNPSSALSWSRFDISWDLDQNCPQTNNHYYLYISFDLGLQAVTFCSSSTCGGSKICSTSGYSTAFDNSLSNCGSIGTSMIASYTFALVFSFAAIMVTGLGFCLKIPVARLLTFAFGIIYLALYIQPLAYWYNSCQNQLHRYNIYETSNKDISSTADDVQPGYAVALAILVVVLSFMTVIINLIRCFRPPAGSSEEGVAYGGRGGRVLSTNAPASDDYYPSSPPGTVVKPPSPGYYPTR